MAYEHSLRRYRNLYATLIRFYPKPYYERFGKGMEQTFSDLLYERSREGGIASYVLWIFFETGIFIIKQHLRYMTSRLRNILFIFIGTMLLLLIPIIGMRVSDGWQWTLSDFIIAFGMIFGTGLAFELISRKGGTMAYRAAVGLGLFAMLLLVWVNAAVGIIGEDNLATSMYVLVPLIGIIGAAVARLKAHGMARTLYIMATAQMLVPVVGLMVWGPSIFVPGVLEIFGITTFFAALFVGSGLLFGRSAALQGE